MKLSNIFSQEYVLVETAYGRSAYAERRLKQKEIKGNHKLAIILDQVDSWEMASGESQVLFFVQMAEVSCIILGFRDAAVFLSIQIFKLQFPSIRVH